MIYVFFSTLFAACLIGIAVAAPSRTADPRIGLLLIGNLSFIDIQLFFAGNSSAQLFQCALMLTILTAFETVRRHRDQ